MGTTQMDYVLAYDTPWDEHDPGECSSCRETTEAIRRFAEYCRGTEQSQGGDKDDYGVRILRGDPLPGTLLPRDPESEVAEVAEVAFSKELTESGVVPHMADLFAVRVTSDVRVTADQSSERIRELLADLDQGLVIIKMHTARLYCTDPTEVLFTYFDRATNCGSEVVYVERM